MEIPELSNNLQTIENKIAREKLAPGPAKLTHIISRFGFLKFRGFTGTGFAQPNPTPLRLEMTNIKVPIGSRWTRGFKVKRPLFRAVGSPNLSATHPCEYS